MRTYVKLLRTPNQCRLQEDFVGYIDGYVKAADDRPYAVMVCGSLIDLVPLYLLEVIDKPDLINGGNE